METQMTREEMQGVKKMDARKQAEQRVNASAKLSEYRGIVLDYDWPEGDSHYVWIASAPESEILSWARDIRRNEQQA